MRRLGGIIDSMTPDERRNPSKVIDQSRRRRIAAGAGVEPHEVNELVKQFDAMSDMMTKMSALPSSVPSALNSAAPMGIPPSANPFRASS